MWVGFLSVGQTENEKGRGLSQRRIIVEGSTRLGECSVENAVWLAQHGEGSTQEIGLFIQILGDHRRHNGAER